ncbi:F-box protein [Candidatus Odyssella thessalonicensis]|uniref:F-box protein n=1 Tax=Candidatus Odyssella thessalonicensis TaxID=84647 RepID=UPI000225C12F|nr:F-box protein [Candidatus Odyssella thessalonicensis]
MLPKFVKRLWSATLALPLLSYLLSISTNAVEVNRGPFNLPAELGSHILSFTSPQDLAILRQVNPTYRDAVNDLLERLPYRLVREDLRVYPFKNMSVIKFMLEGNSHWKQRHINDLFIHLAKHFKAEQDFRNKLPEAFIRFSPSRERISYMLTLAILYQAAERYSAAIESLEKARRLFPNSQKILIKFIKYTMLYGNPQQRRKLRSEHHINPTRVARANALLSSRCRDYSMVTVKNLEENCINIIHELEGRAACMNQAIKDLQAAVIEGYEPAILSYLLKIPRGNPVMDLDLTLKERAKSGQPKAQYYYGLYGLEGMLPMSKTQAQNYLKKAAEQGYAKAQSLLGSFYWVKSKGAADRDVLQAKAASYLKIAAYKGVYSAQYNLGYVFIKKKVYHKAIKIFKKLSDLNFIPYTSDLTSSRRYLWLTKLPATTLYAQALYCQGNLLYRSCYFSSQQKGLDLIVQSCQLNNINALLCYAQILAEQGTFEKSLRQYEVILSLYEEGRTQHCFSLLTTEKIVQQRAEVYKLYSEHLRKYNLIDKGTTFFWQELIKRKKAPSKLPNKNGYSPDQLKEIHVLHDILGQLAVKDRSLKIQE